LCSGSRAVNPGCSNRALVDSRRKGGRLCAAGQEVRDVVPHRLFGQDHGVGAGDALPAEVILGGSWDQRRREACVRKAVVALALLAVVAASCANAPTTSSKGTGSTSPPSHRVAMRGTATWPAYCSPPSTCQARVGRFSSMRVESTEGPTISAGDGHHSTITRWR